LNKLTIYLRTTQVITWSLATGRRQKLALAMPGSGKGNEIEPKSCLGQVFNFKLSCFAS